MDTQLDALLEKDYSQCLRAVPRADGKIYIDDVPIPNFASMEFPTKRIAVGVLMKERERLMTVLAPAIQEIVSFFFSLQIFLLTRFAH
jgi:hypothetical protein